MINRFKHLLSLALLGAIAIVVVGCEEETAQLVATAEPTASPATASQATTSPEPTSIPKTETFNIGDTVQLSDLQITVHGVRTGLGEEFWTPEEGHYFVYIDVGFRNSGEESHAVSSLLQMEMRDADGFSYSTDLGAAAAAKRSSPEGEIAPGGVLRGEIGYQIPITATGLTWHFTGELFRLGQAIFSVGTVAVPSIVSAPTPEPAATSESTLTPTQTPTTVPTLEPSPVAMLAISTSGTD